MDYVVYGGGEQIAAAFRSVALFFSHPGIKGFMSVFIVAGIGFALLSGGISGLIARLENKDASPGFVAVAWTVFGLAIFSAGVLPKTTMHVYDKSRNLYLPVGNVPVLLAYAAGGMNSMENAYRDIVAVSGATPSVMFENGSAFKLLLESTGDFGGADIDHYLHANISEYYRRCLVPAKPDMSKLYNNTNDLLEELKAAAKPGWYMDWRSSSKPEGELTTCETAYNTLKAELNPTASSMVKKLNAVCKAAEFNPNDAQQKNTCMTQLNQAVDSVFGSTSNGWQLLFANSIVANGIREAMLNEGVEGTMKVLLNRSMVSEGMAAHVASDTWMPLVKAFVTAIVIALSTVIFPLLATPLFGKVLKMFIGMIFFVVSWNIADIVITHMFLPGTLNAAIHEVQQNGMGLASMWLTPTSNMKALALLGEARTSGMNIAVILTATITGLSAYGLTSFAQRMTASLDKNADKAAEDSQPEKSGALLGAMANSMGEYKAVALQGMDGFSNARAFDMLENSRAAEAKMEGRSLSGAAHDYGSQRGGEDRGRLDALSSSAAASGRTIEAQASAVAGVSESERQGHLSAMEKIATLQNVDSNTLALTSTEASTAKEQGAKQAMKTEADQNGNDLLTQAFVTGNIEGSKEQGGNRPYVAQPSRASTDAEKQTLTHISDIDATDRVVAQIMANNPNMTEVQAREDLARRGQAANFADANVNQTSAGTETVAYVEGSAKAGHAAGVLETTQANDTTVRDLSKESARIETNQNIGQTNVSKNSTDTQLQNVGEDNLSHSVAMAEEKSQAPGGITQFNKDTADRTVSQESGHNRIWQAVASMTGRTSEQLGLDMAGANTHIALTPENVDSWYEAGMINKGQWEAVKANGGGRLDASMGLDENGKLTSMTTKVAAGDSASSNNSHVVDQSTVFKVNAETGDVNSTREVLSNPQMVAAIYAQEHGSMTLANQAAHVISTIETQSVQAQSQGTVGGGVSLGKGGSLFGGLGANVNAGGSYAIVHHEGYDTQRGAFSKHISSLEGEADRKGLTGSEKVMFVAEHFSGFFQTELERVNLASQDKGNDSKILEDSRAYAEANGLKKPETGHVVPGFVKDIDTSGMTHPMAFQHAYEQARLTQHAPKPEVAKSEPVPSNADVSKAEPMSSTAPSNAEVTKAEPVPSTASSNAEVTKAEPMPSAAPSNNAGNISLSNEDLDRLTQNLKSHTASASQDQFLSGLQQNVIVQKVSGGSASGDDAKPDDDKGGVASSDAPPVKIQPGSNKLPS
ncbi:TPA: conjugal transfer protein TraG N-terminal domain-containing protein [Vibrio cholerae]|nr:conjugal transfer protein TraG N-terminal domain-containing protein [Vibrio cholerae]HCJ7280534.1 conjugal transfer protein TraG N-terminal domain-containing protein [Vibrio cholerae]HCJ7318188.1 conjugal transfer protein TraG N-terminal domain-containing protein [Vibrio cholerae]